MLYFDHNATTPVLAQARQAWLEATERYIGNPSSPHRLGSRAEVALQQARQRLAGFLGCDALDIVWTSGATESNNMVLHHLAGSSTARREVWVSSIEHPCVLASARRDFPRQYRLIPVTHEGLIDLDWLRGALVKKRPAVVAVMAANNETGVLQPWREVLGLCQASEVPFFCDAAQWIGKVPASGLGECDFVSGCAHKFGGPKGVGFLKCPSRGSFLALLVGGQQEEGRRAGTENVPGVLSMMAALEVRETALAAERQDWPKNDEKPVQKRLSWRHEFERELLAILPGAEVVGHGVDRLWNTVSALMPETDCQQRWVVKLDKLGFAASTGSACASGREEPSYVLRAMAYSPESASRVLRFSSGWETTEREWSGLLEALQSIWKLSKPHRQV